MDKIILATRRFLRDEEGATAIEYGLMAALIAVVIIAAVAAIGTNLNVTFQCISDSLASGADECTV